MNKSSDTLNPSVLQRILNDFRKALTTSPTNNFRAWAWIVVLNSVLDLSIGFAAGIYQVQYLDLSKFWFLPFTLLIFPSIPEEFFFRGLLIPRNTADLGWKRATFYVAGSSLAFTLWHPLNALTINPTAQPFFLNFYFNLILFLFGITCGISYILSRSIWVPVLIHWLTVVVWVLFLGGRNLILES